MTESEIKSKILQTFNAKRQAPHENFHEAHFLDFLISPSSPKNSLKKSFKGYKRYHLFMDALELEFGIAFTFYDLDTYYSLDQLAHTVAERMNKGQVNLTILKERIDYQKQWWVEIILTAILGLAYFWFELHWIPLTMTGLVGLFLWTRERSRMYNRRHYRKLAEKIKDVKIIID